MQSSHQRYWTPARCCFNLFHVNIAATSWVNLNQCNNAKIEQGANGHSRRTKAIQCVPRRERGGLILEPGDKLCSMWDRVISKGMHAESVAMAIIIQLGYLLIRRQGYKKEKKKKEEDREMKE